RPGDALGAATDGLARVIGLDDVVWSAPLLALGLRAAAELAETSRAGMTRSGRGRGLAPDVAAAARDLAARLPDLRARAKTRGSGAWLDLAELEDLRADGTAEPARWSAAADAWAAVPDPWLAAYARFRAAESALRAEGVRADAGSLLRAAHGTASALRAAPLQREIEALAARARINLAAVPGVALDAALHGRAGSGAGGSGSRTLAPANHERPAAAKAGRPHGLSEREIEVLALVAAGRSNGEIAERLFITRKTASVHVTHILDKLGVSNRVEAAMVAARLGLAPAADGEERSS
ncbi:MAG TPA: response regulator transcription factor, partial [Candidatus Limnocylindrales bacterium]